MGSYPVSVPQDENSSMSELLVALEGLKVLDALEITDADLRLERSDSNLRETLVITYEFLVALKDATVLDTFYKLPAADQMRFLRWIGATDDPELRQRRTETFVLALKASPLADNDVRIPSDLVTEALDAAGY